jgi:HTH-type transcriptional regulator/antitoxin HigA
MTSSSTFQPQWTSSPGETIADILRERSLSVVDFAQQVGLTLDDARALIDGRLAITIGIARRLRDNLGASVTFWMARDRDYRDDAARTHSEENSWLRELPLRDMVRFGWIAPTPRPQDAMTACLRYFGVPSVAAWREIYSGLHAQVAFRTSPSIDSQPAAVAAWLRKGQVEAEQITCGEWNPSAFQESLRVIRGLTRLKDPKRFLPSLRQVCAKYGVAVVIVRAPSGCRASGATWFLSPEKAVLMLSFRFLMDDQFWFTFFHEAGHLLLHSERTLFLERNLFLEGMDEKPTAEEKEASEFAGKVLVPADLAPELAKLGSEARRVIRFASKVGVSPGIVVGQLQYLKLLRPNQLNSLKRRFVWAEQSSAY